MDNQVTIAVAGSGKTEELAKYCAGLPRDRRVAVLTYTKFNQHELSDRISKYAGDNSRIEVMGWFAFLLRHFARPFFSFKFPGKRVQGFNFKGQPSRYATGLSRFMDANGAVYKLELARLSYELIADSKGALVRRLQCIYDEVLVDEVQDLSGYDWSILSELLNSSLKLRLVGDLRQAVIATNPRAQKNKQYSYSSAIHWFRKQEKRGVLELKFNSSTWRCRPEIAMFSDTIFPASWGFPQTKSLNQTLTGHDGVFLLRPDDVPEYMNSYLPQALRYSAASPEAKKFGLSYLNYGESKGATFERVLIIPTGSIVRFIQSGIPLAPRTAAGFYVAVTRARQSVAIVCDKGYSAKIPYWSPNNG